VKELEFIHFKNRNEFRNWQQKHHDTSPGIWMIFYKKHLNSECIEYNDALEEALCFGWIDSIIRKLDNDRYARKFTPRKNTKKWSEINKRKVVELIREGKMTRSGFEKIDVSVKSGLVNQKNTQSEKKKTKETDIPDFIIKEFARNEPALRNFNNLAPTYRKHYILWITGARREETVMKRINESIGLLKENKKLGLK
jgi:uncharacterized protein YdeI (YjbR/CyaY-like superfamily)